MAKRKYTTDEIIVKLQEMEHLCESGMAQKEALKSLCISENTYYRWRAKYGWMSTDDAKKMCRLEEENQRLKELIQLWNNTFSKNVGRRTKNPA